jgi:sterol desaturase/sphingolipid hydroxylase (fatty acid hydroxylase superfamily)
MWARLRRVEERLGIHPLVVAVELALFALIYRYGSPHLRGAFVWSPGFLLFVVAQKLIVLGAVYGGLFAVFYRLPWRRRFSHLALDPRPPRLLRVEVRRSFVSWTIGALVELFVAATVVPRPLSFATSLALCVLLLAWADLHFYLTHRLLHVRPLYRLVHYAHHQSTRPNPWSSFSFHPVEALVYYSALLVVCVLPVSALHVVLLKAALDLTPAYGHLGFGGARSGSAFHFLHHAKNRCNYGASRVWDLLLRTYRAG